MLKIRAMQERPLFSNSPLIIVKKDIRFVNGKLKSEACCLSQLIIITSMRLRLTTRRQRIATDKASVASQLRSPA